MKQKPSKASQFLDPLPSAYLNIGTSEHDIVAALIAYRDGDLEACRKNILEAINQLRSAETKLAA